MKELRDVSAKHVTSMHCGGDILHMFIVESKEEIMGLLKTSDKFFTLGAGTNTIFDDGAINIPVIKLGKGFSSIDLEAGLVFAGSATPITELIEFSARHRLSGIEFLAGIPGTLGGAVFMNAGTKDQWVMDRVESIEVVDAMGAHRIMCKDINSSYRWGGISEGRVITAAYLRLEESNPVMVQKRIDYFYERRKNQPKGFNSGSVFKNPEGESAGYLIENAGLKGCRVGDASVSSMHANFIINHGRATSSDVRALISMIKQRVRSKFGIELAEEVQIVG